MKRKQPNIFKIASKYINGGITYQEFENAMRNWINGSKEENKLTLKPFDLEAAKAGKPVCTRDGRKARIICFNRESIGFPIIALIKNGDTEGVYQFDDKGRSNIDDKERSYDLMMASEKKEGWINICRNLNTNKTELDTKDIYNTKEEALQNLSSMTYVTTVKINWEE